MRVVAWNLNHRSRNRAIPPALPVGILSLNPDVVVLTEYVEGQRHSWLCAAFQQSGLTTEFHTPFLVGCRQNQVLVASRQAVTIGTFTPPLSLGHARSNCIHVRFVSPALDLIGMRVPMHKSADQRLEYWNWFENSVEPLRESPVVIIGDFNADPLRAKGAGSGCLRRLTKAGWQLPSH